MSRSRAAAMCLASLLITGCIVTDLLKTRRSQQTLAMRGLLSGTVEAADASDSWMVVLIAGVACNDDWRLLRDAVTRGENPQHTTDPELRAAHARSRWKFEIVSHTMLQRSGRWFASLAPGCYYVGAFQDLNRNRHYDNEPALTPMHSGAMFELVAGERGDTVKLVIPHDGRFSIDSFDPFAKQAANLTVRSNEDQTFVSLDAVAVEGEVVDLADPRFGRANGRLGFVDVYTFAWRVGPGVYFLEPYDPKKIPVLFVHGAEGFPQQFAKLIDGLDRTRYQPWFFFYPSGARLEVLAGFLSEQITRLQGRFDFDEMAVVAHSMGGLVARAFILEHHQNATHDPIKIFIAYSTPWDGIESARRGVERSPVVIDSWRDVAAGSEFLNAMFFVDPDAQQPRELPVPFHMIFGVNDQTIPVPSAIRWQVVREAEHCWPLPYGHVDILDSPEASLLLNEMLEKMDD